MQEYCVHIETDIYVDAEDETDAQFKAFDRFIDKGYRGAMTATPTGVNYNDDSKEEA